MDNNQNFLALLSKGLLPKVEIISVVVIGVGFVFNYNRQPTAIPMVTIGLSTLASVFFVAAFLLPATFEKKLQEEAPKTFVDLLALIVWKVMHIALAVAIIGLLFYLLRLKGFSQMMLVGTMTLIISLLVSGFIVLQKNEYLGILKTTILKALAMAILGSYILYINWSLITV